MVNSIRPLLQGSIFPPRIHQKYNISNISYSSLLHFVQYKGIHLAHQYNSGITIMSEISSKTNCTLISVLYQTNRHCQKHRNKPQISLRQKTSVIYQHKKNTNKKIQFFSTLPHSVLIHSLPSGNKFTKLLTIKQFDCALASNKLQINVDRFISDDDE